MNQQKEDKIKYKKKKTRLKHGIILKFCQGDVSDSLCYAT